MALNNIEYLLEKYDNGETSIAEEQQLKAYFAQDEVAPQLESYRIMFQYFDQTKKEQFTKDVPLETKKSHIYKWISVAAVAVLMIGILIPNVFGGKTYTSIAELPAEEQEVYHQTKKALSLLSSNFNDGASSMNALGFMSAKLNKGAEQVIQVKEFSKATNKLLKKKQTPKH
ncbi:hypothetical protein ESY86_03120 [Subsaximicrobium wynnwilliamsii]|uniref:DUF3379 domain-containing protein n=1 Tax=Subsaximicrobium wynnwilliamsii TaxID=291179 RepID=A0A5C6ZKL0_9FLAO|nr:hypothetical protein [Subsaximicrobium wynnwilliamsii]TXD84702.1 hypothetical protein ESY87_02900 [Subsaximicrobium wynnwilliamsii]TXD90372.1 hypothetical protein ESY86_03120 [Subsaximicrobium wynnwilliamsii]TXE04848.1 hypothetical protein ESY88_01430 [Subsaximicrobium wynnwilliamsii]